MQTNNDKNHYLFLILLVKVDIKNIDIPSENDYHYNWVTKLL